jgi:hypothetical protein
MCAALADLKSVAPPDRQGPLDRQLRLLSAAVRRSHEDEEDVVAALTPDTEGIGSGADVTAAPDLDRVLDLAELTEYRSAHGRPG